MSVLKRSLMGNKCFITGGASGLGAALGAELKARGAKVFLVDKDPKVREVAEKIGAYWAVADVTDRGQMERVAWKAVGRMGGMDTCVANAGIARVVTFQSDPKAFDDTIDVNVTGVYNTIRACIPHIRHRNGYVLTNASAGGVVRLFLMAAGYGASKACASTLGHAAHLELLGTGARAGVIYLAEHETPLEGVFGTDIPQTFMKDNKWLHMGHKARPADRAVNAMVRAIERRSQNTYEPWYVGFACHFPGITNMIAQRMHQNVQPTVHKILGQKVADMSETGK